MGCYNCWLIFRIQSKVIKSKQQNILLGQERRFEKRVMWAYVQDGDEILCWPFTSTLYLKLPLWKNNYDNRVCEKCLFESYSYIFSRFDKATLEIVYLQLSTLDPVKLPLLVAVLDVCWSKKQGTKMIFCSFRLVICKPSLACKHSVLNPIIL